MRQAVSVVTGSTVSGEYVEKVLMLHKQIISALSIPTIMPKDIGIEAEFEAV